MGTIKQNFILKIFDFCNFWQKLAMYWLEKLIYWKKIWISIFHNKLGQNYANRLDAMMGPVSSAFWTPVYPKGSYVINLVCSCCWSVLGLSLDISETVCQIFLIFCMKLVHHMGTKATDPDFYERILGVTYWEKPIQGYYLSFFPISLYLHINMF